MSNIDQYDISQPTDYLNRKMFLDPAGPVTLQRFDRVKYPKMQQFEKIQRGYFWVPEEIDVSKDRRDMKEASEAASWMFTFNLLRQTTLDSEQGKAPMQIFGPCVSLPEFEALLSIWGMFETNLHSNSYSHIIRGVYPNPSAVFDQIHDVPEIVAMAQSIGKYYNKLDELNARRFVLGEEVDIIEHKRAIWFALHASYALEAIRFMVSFATSFAMMERKIFIGNGTIIEMILQDEILHTEWTAWIINQVCKEDPDFAQIRDETVDEVYALYQEVIDEEKTWAAVLCQKGPIPGVNEKILGLFVDWQAAAALKEIGVKYRGEVPKSHPIPWFLKHVHLDSKQTARQELEDTNYVIGVMKGDLILEDLPDL